MSMSTVAAWRDAMQVDWPESTHGAAELRQITITESDAKIAAERSLFDGGRGRISPGQYTGLYINGALWMSDTPDEQRDHFLFLRMVIQYSARRVLINGLGLGMVARALCHLDTVEVIDVVDNNPDAIALIGPYLHEYGSRYGKTVNVIEGDAHTPAVTFEKNTRWDVVWHDIWVDICADNWESMKILRRRHARRCSAQAAWCERETRSAVRRGFKSHPLRREGGTRRRVIGLENQAS